MITANSQVLLSQTMNITINNIRSTKGKLSVSIFSNAEEFKTEKPSHTQFFDKTTVKNKTCTVSIEYKPGIYGVAVCDDENNNGVMDYNIIGMPKEGFGLSNYQIKGLSRPVFSDFSFQLKENEKKAITVDMKYL